MKNKNSVKHPCQGCVYYQVCGNSGRTEPCNGRMTKSERIRMEKNSKEMEEKRNGNK